jgi:hypothetical protein
MLKFDRCLSWLQQFDVFPDLDDAPIVIGGNFWACDDLFGARGRMSKLILTLFDFTCDLGLEPPDDLSLLDFPSQLG